MKKHLLLLFAGLLLLLGSCAPQRSEDEKFQALAGNYIEKLLTMNPEWATALGDHRYDGRMNDYSMAGVEADRALNVSYLDSLGGIRKDLLSPVNAIDLEILRTNLQSWIFQIDTLREQEWNPLMYNPGGAIYNLVARDFAPLRDRLKSVESRLKEFPAVLAAARANLHNPPLIYTETAIQQNDGTIGLVRDELTQFLEQVPDLKSEFVPVQQQAVAALREYGTWLSKELLPASKGDFRLGDEKFRRKLYYALESDLTKKEILSRAETELKATQEAMYATAAPIYDQFFHPAGGRVPADRNTVIKAVLDRLSDSHPTNATIVEMTRGYLQSITAYVRDHALVTVPEEPIKVVVMPEFKRGVAVAYCESPGPLEKNGETFFSISPTPKDWSKQRVESFYREYNDYMVQDLTFHEAMPGHYLQLAHANRFKAPTMVRAIFSSGTFVEGWAVYAEQLMAEQGFGGPGVRMQQLKMRLRVIINAIIDQKIHTEGMTQQEAMDLMMKEGFQEEGEAAGKWRRACLSSTQLSTYFVGSLEVNDIRKAYEQKHGGDVSLKEMHDAMLSFGSPAPKYVKEALGL